uniref:C-type lectin domain-containing protein n=1 Tax=Panagrolaimus davidi TaxID=227884 RepID=A0A914Q700_9BILA
MDKTLCYSFQKTQLKYMEAQGICFGMNGNLAAIHNSFENVFINQEAETIFTESAVDDYWIGANDLFSPPTWTWLNESPFDFSDWEKGEPQNISMSNCGAVILQNGRWKSDDCYKEKPFVCLVKPDANPVMSTTSTSGPTTTLTPTTTTTKKPKPKSCPVSWQYYNTTGYCYIVLGGEFWQDAEQRCVISGGHLVSIHSLEEDLYVTHLVSGAPAHGLYGVWIGLYTEDSNRNWKWTDGTPFDYHNWRADYPVNTGLQSFGDLITGDPNGKTADWINVHNYVWKNTFICKASPK